MVPREKAWTKLTRTWQDFPKARSHLLILESASSSGGQTTWQSRGAAGRRKIYFFFLARIVQVLACVGLSWLLTLRGHETDVFAIIMEQTMTAKRYLAIPDLGAGGLAAGSRRGHTPGTAAGLNRARLAIPCVDVWPDEMLQDLRESMARTHTGNLSERGKQKKSGERTRRW